MKNPTSPDSRYLLVLATIFCALSVSCLQDVLAQTPPRWKAHDLARPRPLVVTPVPQEEPVPPPSDAIVLFDGTDLSKWCDEEGGQASWAVEDGILVPAGEGEDIYSVQTFGDVQLHMEWAAPLPARGAGQGRGNSGVFLMGLYEVQILDSYQNDTYADGQAAALYGQYPPLVNACRPPGKWQTYDIIFRRPRFTSDGVLSSPAIMTLLHNGILVQDHAELLGPTMWLQHFPYALHPDSMPISLQYHGNPVRFRNIWVRKLREWDEPGPGSEPTPPVINLTREALDRYTGIYKYRPDAESDYVIESDGRQLRCIFGKKRAKVDLVPNSLRKFSMRWTAAHVEFDLDAHGNATAVSFHVGGSAFTVKKMVSMVEDLPPPVTRVAPVIDVLHGTKITDPYRWLEDQDAPETRDWIARQNAYTDTLLERVEGRDTMRALASKLLKIESVGIPVEAGDRYFYTRRRPDQDLSVLYVREGRDGEDRVLLDPHSMSADHTVNVNMLDVSSDGKVLVYAKREGGADESEIRVLDVDRGRDLGDVLPTALYLGISMRPDGKGFYYATYGGEGPRLLYHALGTKHSRDPVVLGEDAEFQELILPAVSEDGRWLLVNVLDGTSGPTRILLKNIEEDGPIQTVIQDGKTHSIAQVAGDRLLITTDLDAPNRRVMVADVKKPQVEHWKELIPEREGIVVEQATGVGGRIFLSYMENIQSKIAIYGMDGQKLRDIELETIGSVMMGSGRFSSPEAFLVFTSFHVPTTIYRMDVSRGGGLDVWSKMDIPVDSESIKVRQVFYSSKDGTQVPMFVVHRKDLVLDGSNPALLTGYGGFSFSQTPYFDPIAAMWVQQGGVFASANLRGGGEYGEDWHEAGMLANKQNVFDDFAAAATFLAEKGYTRRERLAVMGGSNGGLLTGALLVQRPDLVGAVICAYPLLDMIRYHKLLLGRYWVAEYGSSDDPAQFEYLLEYSPYHNVKEGVNYPATLFITGDLDTRVDPCHARKMAALVQARNAGSRPIMLSYAIRAGHAAAPPVHERIEDLVDMMSFLSWQIGMRVDS